MLFFLLIFFLFYLFYFVLLILFCFICLPAPGYDEHLYSLPGEGSGPPTGALLNNKLSQHHDLPQQLLQHPHHPCLEVPRVTVNLVDRVDSKEPEYANEGMNSD